MIRIVNHSLHKKRRISGEFNGEDLIRVGREFYRWCRTQTSNRLGLMPIMEISAANERLSQITLTMENLQVASSLWIEWLGVWTAVSPRAALFAGIRGLEQSSALRRVRGVQLVAAILVMYPWGTVKVLSRRERCCIQHSESSFLLEVLPCVQIATLLWRS